MNAEFNSLLDAIAIVNADVSGSAAIVFSKLDSTTVAGVSATQDLTNKTLTAPVLSGSVTGTYTLAGTPTLTSPTINKPTINASVQGTSALSPSASATQDLDGSTDNVFLITMPAGNITFTVSNMTAGQFFYVRILQDGTGSRTVTWFSTITWAGATAPTLTTTGSRADLLAFFAKTSSTFDGFIVGQDIG